MPPNPTPNPTLAPPRRRPDVDVAPPTPRQDPEAPPTAAAPPDVEPVAPADEVIPPHDVVTGEAVEPPADPLPSTPPDVVATPDERAGLRLLALRGDALVDSVRAAIARLDRETWEQSPGDPLARTNEQGYVPGRGGTTQWLKFHGEARRTRHALAARLAWLEAVRAGEPAPAPVPESTIEAAVAADLVRLWARGCAVLPPVRRIASTLARQVEKAAGELEPARAMLTDEAVLSLGPDPSAAWDTLAHRTARVEDLEGKLARWRGALDRLPSCLARHVGAAIDALGGDRAIAAGLAVSASPIGAAPLASDPVVAGLEKDLSAARAQVEQLAVTAARGGASEAQLDAMRESLLSPTEARIAERKARLVADREAAVADAVEGRFPEVMAARSGDVDAVDALLKATRSRPESFPPRAAAQLEAAAGEALAEAGAREFAEFLEKA